MPSGHDKTAEEWFSDLLAAGENDPDFLTEELLLDITEQISLRMHDLGLRASDLAERLGVSRAYVSQLLGGRPNMTMRTLVGVAHALGRRVRIELRAAGEDAVDHLDRSKAEPRLMLSDDDERTPKQAAPKAAPPRRT